MGTKLRTNTASLKAVRHLNNTNRTLHKGLNKMTSGQRINTAADDAGGLSIASSLKTKASSMTQAIRNTNAGISMMQTAEGKLDEMSDILARLRELSVQAANETYSSSQRANADVEYTNLMDEMKRIASTASFNRHNLLNSNETISLQIGIENGADYKLDIDLANLNATLGSLGITGQFQSLDDGTGNFNTQTFDILDKALQGINTRRAFIGAIHNRLENSLQKAQQSSEDLVSSSSKIYDADFAQISSETTRHQIMQQAGMASLGQASDMPQTLIQLLT